MTFKNWMTNKALWSCGIVIFCKGTKISERSVCLVNFNEFTCLLSDKIIRWANTAKSNRSKVECETMSEHHTWIRIHLCTKSSSTKPFVIFRALKLNQQTIIFRKKIYLPLIESNNWFATYTHTQTSANESPFSSKQSTPFVNTS